ncbi:MAG: hypothetical protein HY272_06300 [Gammaproteobacteria bacterium]|nr:hypothetical protein [Gammaproteobacteria bacterium]
MKTIFQQLKYFTLITSAALWMGGSVMAEDVEVYLGNNLAASDIRPNITFIIDTSGSMNTADVTETAASPTYDATGTYTGSCSATRVYWSTTGTPPDCSTTNQYVSTSANKCNASASALGSSAGASGYYSGRFAQNNSSTWGGLSTSQHTNYLECQTDWGVHGKASGDGKPYPANGANGPWNSNVAKGIAWAATGGNYTLYSGNYLNWRTNPTITISKTRLETVKEVFANLMGSLHNVNIAIMRYDNRSTTSNLGGYFVMPMQQLTDANKQSYIDTVNAFTAGGYTPLAETLYESYLYYRGDTVKFGNSTSPAHNVASVLDPANSNKYKSPIEYPCQKNFVVFLTDGEPTYDTDADTAIKALSGFSGVTGSATCSGDCMDELAQYMNTKDCRTNLDGDQKVSLYTVGFGQDVVHVAPNPPTAAETLLTNAATKGGGKFYTAVNSTELTDAFNGIMVDILAVNTSFIAPAVSVNAFNRFAHRSELYYALFKPSSEPKWYGNVKRFKLTGDPATIVDANLVDAVDVNTGFFKTTATSFWTPATEAPDGDDVKKGGAASVLALPRTVYTYTGATAPNNVILSAASNSLNENNTAVTKTMLGDAAMTDVRRTELLQWVRGVDLLDEDTDTSVTDIRHYMGAPLHSKPVLITYGGTDASPDITLFVGTSEGNLAAINASNGTEVFSFTPQELLPNLATLYDNSSNISTVYGLDGPLTKWVNDANDNGVLLTAGGATEAGEFAYLYQGMRRGGKNYYALNVTNRSAPVLKWVITGGVGEFSELAQTWSSAQKTKIKLNGTDRNVLIFGGGYDPAQDSNTTVQNDTMGRAVFIVDADTGAKLWQAGPAGSSNGGNPNLVLSDMKYSIPSDVSIIDINHDGYADRLYVGDMGGQIWRFDLSTSNTGAGNLATAGVIAKLGDTTVAGNRRFYYATDVSLSLDKSNLNIAIGSGWREHPLDTAVHDAFFIIRDTNIYGPALDANGSPVYTAITLSDLYDATANDIGQGVTTTSAALSGKKGLYIWLKDSAGNFIGEKVVAPSVTLAGMVLFTTYTPTAAAANSCAPSQGVANFYLVNVTDFTPKANLDGSADSTNLTTSDRKTALTRGGLASTPSVIINGEALGTNNADNAIVILCGAEKCIKDPDTNKKISRELLQPPIKTYWQKQ